MAQNKHVQAGLFNLSSPPIRPVIYLLDRQTNRAQTLSQILRSQGLRVEMLETLSRFQLPSLAQNSFPIIIWNVDNDQSLTSEIFKEWKKNRSLSLILLASSSALNSLLAGVQEGLIDQIISPDHWPSLLAAIKSEIQKESYRRELSLAAIELDKLRQAKDLFLRRAEETHEIYNATIEILMTALDLRDVETFGHSRVVARYSQALARLMGIEDSSLLDHIRQGALLHDIGKIAIPDSILKKPGHLSVEEWKKIKLHPTLGYGLIKEIKLVKEIGHIILYHHERYDGHGYPYGLKKDRIPLEARIFALADSLDAITSHRPYHQERDFKTAREEIIAARGKQFDPKIVDAFCSLPIEDWEKIRYETTKISAALENFQG